VQWGEVIEEDLLLGLLRVFEVDGFYPDERKVFLVVFGRTDLAGYGIAGAEVEPLDLGVGDINIVRTGQVIVVGRAQESEPVFQDFQDALGKDEAAFFPFGPG
jgi:hypothetical protein